MRVLVTFLVLSVASLSVSGDQVVSDQWSEAGQWFTELAWPHRARLLRYLDETSTGSNVQVSASCTKSLQLLASGLRSHKHWATSMLDASGKVKSGFILGDLADFGKYDQCLDIKSDNDQVPFAGKYCMYKLHMPLPDRSEDLQNIDLSRTAMNDSWLNGLSSVYKVLYAQPLVNGLCFPSVCSNEDIEHIVRSYMDQAGVPIKFEMYKECDTKSTYEQSFHDFPLHQKVAMATIGLMVLAVVLCTLMVNYWPGSAPRFARFFDANENTKKLFYEVRDEEVKRLSFLNGTRFAYFILSIALHIVFTTSLTTSFTHMQLTNTKSNTGQLISSLVATAGNVVGINFIMSGALAYFSWHDVLVAKKGKLPFPLFALARYIRTTPMIMATLLMIFAFPVTWGSGPAWQYGYHNVTGNCFNGWFHEITYLSNQKQGPYICFPPGWYLAADFQLYILSFPILILLYKRPRLGLTILSLGIVATPVFQAVRLYANDSTVYWDNKAADYQKAASEAQLLHFSTTNYISSYFIGLFLGWAFKNKLEVEDRRFYVLGWLLASSVAVSSYAMHSQLVTNELSRVTEVIFGSLLRTLASVTCAWVAYCCWARRAGWLGAILSAPFWEPLGRISYPVFMVHYLYVWYENFNLRDGIEFRNFSLAQRVMSTLLASHILGFFAHLVFEAPYLGLAKSMLVKKKADPVVSRSGQQQWQGQRKEANLERVHNVQNPDIRDTPEFAKLRRAN
ncbi:Nose resistant to fluoxetine protein 6 [Halotydeus destructor]|nr:Nose resistant to fluoxetine protein 6 [Halotydeus destructor]